MRIRNGDVELYLRSAGDPAAPTTVLVHGYPDTSAVWDEVAARLAPDHHVVVYDVRGAGASSAPRRTSAYRLARLVDDLAAVADAVSPARPIHLVGHDWGSIQSWEAVATDRMQGRIASFTSISGPCLDHVGHRLRRGWSSALLRQLASSWYIFALELPLVPSLAWRFGLGRRWPRVLARVEDLAGVPARPSQADDGVHGAALYRANIKERLLRPRDRRTRVPVQLIVPLADHFVRPVLVENTAEFAPVVARHEVDAGHWLPLSHPGLVARHVAEHVARFR